MRNSILPAMLRLTGLLLLACVLSALALPVGAQSESESIVATLDGTGDDVIQITSLSGLIVARIHGNGGSNYFAVKTYDRSGNLVSLLVNTTTPYIGIVPLTFDAYNVYDLNGGLIEVTAQDGWSIEVIVLNSLAQAQNTQVLGGYGDYVGYVKGSALTAGVYGNEASQYFSVSAIGMSKDSGQGNLLVNTTTPYEGNVRLPTNKDGLIVIVKATGMWVISFNTSITGNIFDAGRAAFTSNPYSPFKDVLDKPTSTPSPAPTTTALPTPKSAITITTTPSSTARIFNSTVIRNANLRAGPGTNYAIVGAAKANQKINIIGKSADGSWLQLDDNAWIAAFLVNQEQAAPPATPSPDATATSAESISVKATVRIDSNLRAGHGSEFGLVGIVKRGEEFYIVGSTADKEWYKLADGSWIYGEMLDTRPADVPVVDADSTVPQ